MSKHTPGPWTVSSDQFNPDCLRVEAPARMTPVARIPLTGLLGSKLTTTERDATLIAAAPDLYEALNRLFLASNHSDFCEYSSDSMSCSCGYKAAAEQAFAALRKAEGKP